MNIIFTSALCNSKFKKKKERNIYIYSFLFHFVIFYLENPNSFFFNNPTLSSFLENSLLSLLI